MPENKPDSAESDAGLERLKPRVIPPEEWCEHHDEIADEYNRCSHPDCATAPEHAVSSGWFRGEYWVECSCGETATCSRGREWVGGDPRHIHTNDCLPQSCPATWPIEVQS